MLFCSSGDRWWGGARFRSFVLVFVAVFFAPALAKANGTITTSFVVGKISDNPEKHYSRLEKMADFIVEAVGDPDLQHGLAYIAPDNQRMIEAFRHGEVDMVSESIMSAVKLVESGFAEFALREWKKGVPSYHSVFFVRKNSEFQSLKQLIGYKIAFEDRGSTSAFLVPYGLLTKMDLRPVELSGQKAGPIPGRLGYLFAKTELGVATWVDRSIVDVGVLSSTDWSDPSRVPEKLKARLRIIHEGAPVIRSVVLLRKSLPEDLKAKVRRILTSANTRKDGRTVLEQYAKVKKYDELVGKAADDLEASKELYSVLKALVP